MSASIASIVQKPAAAPAQGPLAKHLRHEAIEVLHRLVKAMFDSADDTLFDWARNAVGDEQHHCMSLMRLLRVRRAEVVEQFFKAYLQQFDHPEQPTRHQPQAIDAELSMQSTDELETSIAITNMTARAEGLFRDPLFDLGLRLDWAADHRGERIDSRILEPQAISEAFLSACRPIDLQIEPRLVVLKLFERSVMIQLGDFYDGLLRALDKNGVQAADVRRAKQQAEPEPEPKPPPQMAAMLKTLGAVAAPPPAPGMPGGAGVMPSFAGPGAAAAAPASGYNDALLAAELSQRIAEWLARPQGGGEHASTGRRAELVGRMFDQYQRDPGLSASAKPLLESLRFPVLKAALADAGFLSNPQHPLRVLLRDLTVTAGTARTSDQDPAANLKALSDAVAPLLTPEAAAVRATLENPAPVTEDEVQAFLGQLDAEASERRKVVVQRGLQRVDEELKRVTESRELLAAAEVLVDRALRPLLGLTLLRHSSLSPLWTQSLNLADRVIRSVDMARAAEFSRQDRTDVREDLEDTMVLERIPRERSEEALGTLRGLHEEIESYLELKTAPPPPKAPTPEPQVRLLDFLVPQTWYRVYNSQAGTTHWMRLLELVKATKHVVFSGFDADHKLAIPLDEFERELIRGRNDPLDPPPAYASALAAARRR